ncbi:MAG TPA: valine--pyruvate transaminase, partial [Gammaproteobacteria bacterium]|nr:valine--pyruvate transaminase [Gammaproteobacteria bacterium]
PAPINQLNEIFIKEITKLIDKSEIASVIGRYDSPRGNAEFIKALSIMFNKHYKW